MPAPRLIIGLGTGRCGTHSLAALLGRQPQTAAHHQPSPCLPWAVDYGWYGEVARFVAAQREPVVGLVAWYYLPYASLLLRDFDVRFVCLKREREATVRSVMRLAPEFDNWSNRSVHESPTPAFRALFPQFDVDSREEALRRYWDLYYREVAALEATNPDRVLVVPTDALNDRAAVDDLLRFAGYGADRDVSVGIREGVMEPYRWRGSDPAAT